MMNGTKLSTKKLQTPNNNGTWTLTDLHEGKRAVGCKWVYTMKFKADGSMDRYKARLVARGFN